MTDPHDRLDSWKEIAAYLNRSVRTVTRWEREEGLPVHRHLHSKAGTVYAFKPELDAWWTARGAQIDRQGDAPSASSRESSRGWMVAAIVGVVLALTLVVRLARPRDNALAPPALVPLTTYPGIEGPPSLSPDGNQVTFERDGDIFVKTVDGEALVPLTHTDVPEYAPAWSPDGRRIAFGRAGGVFVISPLGGGERKIADTASPLLLKTMAWTPDARRLVISELTSPICASLFLISIETGRKTRLTFPPEPSIGDGWPAVSADGRLVAFARYAQDTSAEIHVVPLAGGEPRQITADQASISGLVWTSNDDVVFSSTRGGPFELWRVAVTSAGTPAVSPVQIAREAARFPSVSRPQAGGPRRLAYQRLVQNVDIRRAEIVDGATAGPVLRPSQPFIASTRSDDHPRYSPDGTKIAFVSDRSGTHEIWVCASDGSSPIRLTSMAGPPLIGPQWSPDGRRIAYFAAAGLAGKYVVYVIDANGGPPSLLTQEGNLEALPAWSPDGRFLYVTAGRSGSLQILKVPVDGGPPVQVTRRGGAEAAVSPDGRTIYYAKVPEMGTGLWTVPADGGDEVQLLASARFGYWALARRGIYFVDFDETPDGPRPVKFYDLGSHRITQIGTLEETVAWTTTPGFAISPDGRWLLYTNLESTEADLMLVDPFR